MSDPLSVAISVAGIVSLGIQVTQTLYNYYNAFANAESDVAHILTKLDSLLELLDSLHRQLKDRKFRSNDRHVLACMSRNARTALKISVIIQKSLGIYSQKTLWLLQKPSVDGLLTHSGRRH